MESSRFGQIKIGRSIWIAILAGYTLYAGVFIYRNSFVVNGERYFTLFDDAMISMRYAKNLAAGRGLVWNPGGEKIEGFTNPLWVLYMALFHFLPISPAKIGLCIQISGALFMLLNLCLVRKIAAFVSGGSELVSLWAVILTALYLPLNNWALQGMEVSLLTLLLSIAAWNTLKIMEKETFPQRLFLLLGAATLVRLDMAVPYLVVLIFVAMSQQQRRWRYLEKGALILGAFIAGQTILRLYYLNDILPNTYYLKMTGYPLLLRLSRGIYVMLAFIYRCNLLLFMLPLGLLFFRKARSIVFLFSLILGQMLYSIWVGGDAWEWWGGSNRYLSIAMPFFFILFSAAAVQGTEVIGGLLAEKKPGAKKLLPRGLTVFFLFSLLSFNMINEFRPLRVWLLLDPAIFHGGDVKRVKEALIIDHLTDAQATIAVTWAGLTPYFADRTAIDMLGKTDRFIAREEMRGSRGWTKLIDFLPGHMKWDYHYSLGKLKPDVIVHMWHKKIEARPYLKKDYTLKIVDDFHIYFRNNSPHVLWDKLENYTKLFKIDDSEAEARPTYH